MLTAAEIGTLRAEVTAMWKYELVGLYTETVKQQCKEADARKLRILLHKAEIMSDEILVRMRR